MRLTSLLKKHFIPIVWAFLALGSGSLLRASDTNWLVMDGHQSTIFTEGPVAQSQTSLFFVTCWVTLFVFVIVPFGLVMRLRYDPLRAKIGPGLKSFWIERNPSGEVAMSMKNQF